MFRTVLIAVALVSSACGPQVEIVEIAHACDAVFVDIARKCTDDRCVDCSADNAGLIDDGFRCTFVADQCPGGAAWEPANGG